MQVLAILRRRGRAGDLDGLLLGLQLGDLLVLLRHQRAQLVKRGDKVVALLAVKRNLALEFVNLVRGAAQRGDQRRCGLSRGRALRLAEGHCGGRRGGDANEARAQFRQLQLQFAALILSRLQFAPRHVLVGQQQRIALPQRRRVGRALGLRLDFRLQIGDQRLQHLLAVGGRLRFLGAALQFDPQLGDGGFVRGDHVEQPRDLLIRLVAAEQVVLGLERGDAVGGVEQFLALGFEFGMIAVAHLLGQQFQLRVAPGEFLAQVAGAVRGRQGDGIGQRVNHRVLPRRFEPALRPFALRTVRCHGKVLLVRLHGVALVVQIIIVDQGNLEIRVFAARIALNRLVQQPQRLGVLLRLLQPDPARQKTLRLFTRTLAGREAHGTADRTNHPHGSHPPCCDETHGNADHAAPAPRRSHINNSYNRCHFWHKPKPRLKYTKLAAKMQRGRAA